MDFCTDLKQWTTKLLSEDNIPKVHSVSYGVQGNLSEVPSCGPKAVADIDEDFKKLAAKGITIIFASGDSGSGETGGCEVTLFTKIGGKPIRSLHTRKVHRSGHVPSCCAISRECLCSK